MSEIIDNLDNQDSRKRKIGIDDDAVNHNHRDTKKKCTGATFEVIVPVTDSKTPTGLLESCFQDPSIVRELKTLWILRSRQNNEKIIRFNIQRIEEMDREDARSFDPGFSEDVFQATMNLRKENEQLEKNSRDGASEKWTSFSKRAFLLLSGMDKYSRLKIIPLEEKCKFPLIHLSKSRVNLSISSERLFDEQMDWFEFENQYPKLAENITTLRTGKCPVKFIYTLQFILNSGYLIK